MKISVIQGPAFGYDKRLNTRLEKTLKDNPSDLNNSLADLNSFCNSVEDKITSLEKRHAPRFEIDGLAVVLMSAKAALTSKVAEIFPHLDYLNIESGHYYVAQGKKNNGVIVKNDWRTKMVEVLRRGDVEDLLTKKDAQIEELVHENNELLADVDIVRHNIYEAENPSESGPKTQDSNSSVISQFKPTADSPLGFASLGGMNELMEELRDKIITPILEPEAAKLDAQEYGKKYPRGILLYGPPGCGKTFITEALAMEADIPLFKLKVSQAGSEYINKTSRNYEAAFQVVADKAKETGKPCLLLIDEIDAVTKSRDTGDSVENLKQMQTLLDLIENARGRGIVVIGATNAYGLMDDAITRRFDEQIYVGMPDFKTRKAILIKNLEKRLKGAQLIENENKINEIAKNLDGFSNSSICIISDKAALIARKADRADIDSSHYTKAILECQNLKVKEDKYVPRTPKKIGFAF